MVSTRPGIPLLNLMLTNLALLVSSQGYYNGHPQYPQSMYMGDMHGPQASYNNYFNSHLQQNGAQQWESHPQGPQFIYASHSSDAGKKRTGGKNKSGVQDINSSTNAMEDIPQHNSITNVTNDMQVTLENASPRLSIFSSNKDPVLYYSFSNVNGKNVIDDSGKGNGGVLSGQVTMEQLSPVCGFGLRFKNGALTVDPAKLGSLVKKELAVVAWVKIDTLSVTNIIYSCSGGGATQRLEVNAKYGTSNGYIRWLYTEGAGNIFNVQTDAVVTPGVWTHIGAAYNGDKGKLKIFVDGQKILTKKDVTKVKQISLGQRMVVGKFLDAAGQDTEMHLEGYLDEFYIFDDVTDESQVEKLMGKCDFPTTDSGLAVHLTFDNIQGQQIIGNSASGIDGKLVGQTLQDMFSQKCKKGIELAQGQGYIELDGGKLDAQSKDAMTISVWIRLLSNERVNTIYGSTGPKGLHHLTVKSTGSPNAVVKWLHTLPDGKVIFDITTEPAIPAGIWTHLAVVYNGGLGKVKIFVDSVKILTTTEGVVKEAHVPWSTPVTIGKLTGNDVEFFAGALDEFYIFTGALMHAEVEALMSKCEFPSGSTLYFVDVTTGSEPKSGTPSRVFLKLIGEKGEHGETELGTGFDKGSTRPFNVYSTNIGNPVKISIRKDTKGLISKDWYLEKVIVTVDDRTDGPSFIFNCKCWIGKGKDDLQKYLNPEKHVDGIWSPWSEWSGCGSGLCGGNKKVRTRSCTNPSPTGGGKKCPGNSFEEGICPVDGGWGAWGSWTPCSKTCGGAMVTRERKCDNPVPENGGKPCDAKGAKETKNDCNVPCETGPTDGHWSEWSAWSACAKSCGGSKVTRTRTCNNPPPQGGGEECPGDGTETSFDCETPCPVDGKWGEWEPWSECSTTCGPGTMSRTRECDSPAPQYGGTCPGNGQETQPCELRACATNVVNGAWGPWGPFSACSETEFCNRGSQVRTRQCNNPAPQNGGELCPGSGSESQECPKTNCKETAVNVAATKTVDPRSFIGEMCGTTTAELISDSLKNDLVAAVLVNLPKLAPALKGGYFAIKADTAEQDELCFEPKELLTIAQLAQLYPSFRTAKSMPFFKVPGDTEHVKGVKVNLKKDKALNGVEFLLGETSSYAPTDTVSLENAMFLYQVAAGNERIVAHGFNRIGSALFAAYASSVGEGGEVVIEGSSSQSVSSEEIEAALSSPESDYVIRVARHITDSKAPATISHREKLKRRNAVKVGHAKKSSFTRPHKTKMRSVSKRTKQRSMVPSYVYHTLHEINNDPIDNSIPDFRMPPPLYTMASPQVRGMTTGKLDQKILDLLKRVGLGIVTISDLSLNINADMKEVTLRVSGKAAPKVIGGWFTFEIIRKNIFAVGFTADQAAFEDFVEKLFDAKLGLFNALEKTSFGISFAQKGFKVTKDTKFKNEPLQSLMTKEVPGGLFFAAQTKFATNCGQEPACKFGKVLMGKDSWLKFQGGVNTAGVKVAAGVYGIPIKGDLKFNKIELFVEVKFGTPPTLPSIGFAVELNVPVKGEVNDKGEEVPSTSLKLGGKLELKGAAEIGTTLYMNGMWRKAFGLSYLSIGNIQIGFTVTLAGGVPTEFKFNGRLEIGRDCQGADDFKVEGRCVSGEALVGISANPANQYIYGELSPLTIGKILRMLGSKLQLPPAVEESGFPKGLIISASWKDQKVPYAGSTKAIKKGVFIKGTINILGFAPAVEILLSDEKINFDLELDPIKLMGGVEVLRSLEDKKKGPKFYVHAKRNPLKAEIYIQGAVVIFGFETEIMFNLTNERIEAQLSLNLFSKFKASVWIAAGYGNPFAQTGFQAKFTIETGFDELSKKAAELLQSGLEAARKALEKARLSVKEAKDVCEKNAGSVCNVCEKLACDKISEECKRAMDEFKHFIGEKVDKFGRKVKSIGEKFKSGFTQDSTKRYMDLLAMEMNCHNSNEYSNYTNTICHKSHHGNSTTYRRRKRFVGKLLCEKLAVKACGVTKGLCKGSCNAVGHITKGMCKTLDLAHHGLYLLEKATYWAERAVLSVAKNILTIHKLSFETHITASPLDSSVTLGADISIFGSRGQFKLEFNLADPLKNVHKLADTALAFFKKLFSPRFSKAIYDKPSEEADYEFSGEFRVQLNGSKDCLSVPPDSKAGSPVVLGSCDGRVSEWLFTLTGALMNTDTGLCVAMGRDQGLDLLKQEICDVKSEEQKFTCKGNTVTPEKNSGLCVTASAGKTGTSEVQAKLLKCDNETSDEQLWILHGDPRALSICDKFVPDVALNKPALQSSLLAADAENEPKDEKGNPVVIPGVGPELAVDGNMSTVPSMGSCSMTALEVDPWWRVDLQREHVVTDVNVVSSSGPLSKPLSNFEVRVGMLTDHKRNPMCGDLVRQLAAGEVWTAECKPPIPGSQVSVSVVGKGYLAICEVAVFARLDNQGKCSGELSRKRDEITHTSPEDL